MSTGGGIGEERYDYGLGAGDHGETACPNAGVADDGCVGQLRLLQRFPQATPSLQIAGTFSAACCD
jgi:hypothetical protein